MSPFKRNRITASQSKSVSRRMRSSNIGTHNRVAPSARSMNASSVGFSSPRKTRRASKGEVRNIMPSTTSGESSAAYNRRVSTREFSQQIQSRRRLQRVLLLLALAVIILVVGVVVGVNAFFGLMGSKMGLSDSSATEVLVEQAGQDPFYVLVSADLDDSDGNDDGVDLLSLVRIDPAEKRATFVGFPSSTYVSMSDGMGHKIVDARRIGGTKELVSAVADVAGVKISHLVTTNVQGITKLAQEMGGVTLNLSEEVDDPNAGGVYIAAGQQTLEGEQLVTFLRASNYSDGVRSQMVNQGLTTALVLQYLSKDGFLSLATRLDRCAGAFQTDWSGSGLYGALSDFVGFSVENAYTTYVPGYRDSVSADASYVVSSASFAQLMEQVNAGQNPLQEGQVDTSGVDPSKIKVEVRNGSGIDGGASSIAQILESAGYVIDQTGNADSYVYGETLVVYKKDAMKAAAESVVETLGTGRAIAANGFYSFSTDVLVILGGDWKPMA
ncbi:MAG: LCP family protein [Eggerthellales bacterium]|nr:LCP family protein [Eggerthellales bacterium]